MEEAEKKRFDAALTALADYQSRGDVMLTSKDLQKLLRDESDRGLVILLATYIEDRLLDRICKAMPNGEECRRSLTKGGPLRSFEHRLAIARALNLVSEMHLENLDVLRAMRNACAHSRRDISF